MQESKEEDTVISLVTNNSLIGISSPLRKNLILNIIAIKLSVYMEELLSQIGTFINQISFVGKMGTDWKWLGFCQSSCSF